MFQATEKSVTPFLKWAGGKRWLFQGYPGLFPSSYTRYLEPFIGGASIFFALSPKTAFLSDANPLLVECYTQMRDHSDRLWKLMLKHQRLHCDEYYYEIRSKKFRSPTSRAAQFLYLNRTCWNGLYRVNLKGEFNVPRGTKNQVVFDGEDFSAYARLLAGAKFTHCDFEDTLAKAQQGDFIFIDPPYTVKHNCNGFKKYNENIFSWSDQIRLRDAVVEASKCGAGILVCNANHEDISDLYASVGSKQTVHRKSVIAADASFRAATSEIAIVINYDPVPNQFPTSAGDIRIICP